MNLLRLAAMVQQLGISVDFTALGPLVPLLSKTVADIEYQDIESVLSVFKLDNVAPELIAETVTAVRTSDFNTLADMLGDVEYLYPIVQKFLMSNSRIIENLTREQPYVMITCLGCGRSNFVDRKSIAVMAPNADVKVTCLECEQSRHLKAGVIASHIG